MNILIDQNRFTTDATTLGGVIAAARDHLSDSHRLIVEVRLDGDTVASDDLENLHDQPVTADEMQLITADPYELARQTLLDVKDALAMTREDQQNAATLLQADKPAEALDVIKLALGTWQQAQQTLLQSARLVGVALDEVVVEGQPVPVIVGLMAEQLKTVRDQLVAGDWIGLADMLNYDLDEAVTTWSAMIDVVSDLIKRKKDATR